MKISAQRGYSLLEVLIAIAIFAIGMMALAALQGSLTRSSSDANLRSVATNIAERSIEGFRAFGVLDTGLGVDAYGDIVDVPATDVAEGGITYSRTIEVTDYWYDLASDTFTDQAPAGAPISDFKRVDVTVSWGAGAEFQVDDTQTLSDADIGTGEVTLSAMISSVTTQGSARATTQTDDDDFSPLVDYTPGANPDIVSLTLGDSKFKESLTPEPDVIRAGELVETRFDVITYSTNNNNSLFLRREEFIGVSCECILRAPPGDAAGGGRRPTIWLGDEYLEPEFVNKPYGESALNFQSPLCDTCCQDHHDGGAGAADPAADTGAILYDPFRSGDDYHEGGAFDGDHKHYKKNNRGELSLALADGDVYVEACKMVRKDGFFRVAQDFRQEGLNVFQYDFLDETAEVDAYSAYLTDAILAYVGDTGDGYQAGPPVITPPLRTPAGVNPPPPMDLTAWYTYLPTALGAEVQQLRSRGIYLDYLSDELRAMIDCLAIDDVETCNVDLASDSPYAVKLDQTGSGNILELLPFFEVQTTFLNRWRETPPNDPVDTTNEELQTDNAHSRGEAQMMAQVGSATVFAKGHKGNLGLTDTDPIDFNFAAETREAEIEVIVNNDNPPAPQGRLITGLITSGVNGLQATSVTITVEDALCNRTPTGFDCIVGGGNPTITVSGYQKQNRTILACSSNLPTTNSGFDNNNNPFTVFDLKDVEDGGTYNITIEEDVCSA